ncbi:MAG: porin [Agrobacterium cavarae]|uniref:porin n=1 Tax=Agrobacterium cavarae TaxID=2528239 RepID=UPI000DDF23E6|nr:porin [Agrobacterium cavarae]
MNIKSLLIGSAAALAAVSGAKAADAIVAAEPEPLEYVRVCDAFGAGFFYIPGSETCLKFDGYVRFQTGFGRDASGTSDWDSFTRAQFNIDTKTDTELGTLRGYIGLRGNADTGVGGATVGTSGNLGSGVFVDQAFIELGGLKVGKFYNWWDDGLSGETDLLSSNTLFNSVRYTYDTGSFYAGLSVDELEGISFAGDTTTDNNVGISAAVGTKLGGAALQLVGGYDIDREDGAVRLIATADVGPGTLGLSGVWASGVNSYYALSEWAVAAEYAIKATDKLTITPGVQYLGNVATKTNTFAIVNADWSSNDAWTAGLTVDYKITQGLSAKIAANYYDEDNRPEFWTGFVRLQRSF